MFLTYEGNNVASFLLELLEDTCDETLQWTGHNDSFKDLLDSVNFQINSEKISIDYELIFRCILGIEYDVSTKKSFEKNKEKNLIVHLINSSIFDMDKLDYIIRDSVFTGINCPTIDTKRLFRNMYLSNKYTIVFTSKAVPVLQNMIEARDGLYMYVYNHHTAIFSDYMYSYIQRRMSHNTRDYIKMTYPTLTTQQLNELYWDSSLFMANQLGFVLSSYLFSVDAVVSGYRTDSDWICLLNVVFLGSKTRSTENLIVAELNGIIEAEKSLTVKKDGKNVLYVEYVDSKNKNNGLFIAWHDPTIAQKKDLAQKIQRTFKLVENYENRRFLKPWWKTIFEFSNFMNKNFIDDNVRKNLCRIICNGGSNGLKSSEFRSQIAKIVVFITKALYDNGDLTAYFVEDDFFVIKRPNRFFNISAIEKLDIALQKNHIVEISRKSKQKLQEQNYYIKNINNIIPQKDYSSFYTQDSFYVYSRDMSDRIKDDDLEKFNNTVQSIFVFVATELIKAGEPEFIDNYGINSARDLTQYKKMYKKYLDSIC